MTQPLAPSPYAPAPGLRPAPRLAAATWALAVLLAVLQVGSAVTAIGYRDRATAAAQEGSLALDVYDVSVLLWGAVLLASYVVTCAWLFGARTRAERLHGTDGWARSKVWVWLGWWVPVVLFWFPLQVVRDIADRSAYRTPLRPPALGLWWTGWLVMLLSTNLASSLADGADASPALPVVEAVAAVATVLAAWRWVVIVRAIERGLRFQTSALGVPASP